MVISSEFRMEQYRDDHRDDAPHFIEWHMNYLIHLIYFNNLEWRGYFDILTVMYFCVFLIESRSSWLGVSWRFDLRKIRSGQIFL